MKLDFLRSYFNPSIVGSLKHYSFDKLKKDLLAGVVVGVVALPLAIAFAIASGVSPEKGIITAIIAGVVGAASSGSHKLISGPTGAFIIITSAILQKQGLEGLAIATFMAGIFLVIMGLLRLGKIIQFIPYPIVVGFNSGIALSIFTSQVKDVLGMSYVSQSTNFVDKWIEIGSHISQFSWIAFVIAVVSFIAFKYIPRISGKFPGMLLALILVTATCYVLKNFGMIDGIVTIGERFSLNASLPTPQALTMNFEYFSELFSSAFTIAAMGAIVTLMTCTVSDGASGDKHAPNTELISQGLTNIASPLFGGIPSTGAIARTMTNINNGGQTPIASLFHALTLLAVLLFLGPLTQHIPIAALAGMLVLVSYNMSDWRTFRALLKNPRQDVYVLITTFALTVLVDLTSAIEIGMLLAIFLLFRRVQESCQISVITDMIDPNQETDADTHEEHILLPKGVEVYEIDGPFFFGIANRFEEMMKVLGDKPKMRILRMRRVPFIDSTGIHNLEVFARFCQKEHIHLILSGVNETVLTSLQNSGTVELIGSENIFDNINTAVDAATLLMNTRYKAKTKSTNHSE